MYKVQFSTFKILVRNEMIIKIVWKLNYLSHQCFIIKQLFLYQTISPIHHFLMLFKVDIVLMVQISVIWKYSHSSLKKIVPCAHTISLTQQCPKFDYFSDIFSHEVSSMFHQNVFSWIRIKIVLSQFN